MRLLGPEPYSEFRTLPDCNLKAMCDINEARLKHLKTLYPEVEGVTELRASAQWHGSGCGRHRHVREASLSL